jgi:hypothetical protein
VGLKEDADFARYLTMGAYGAAHVKQDLESRGHRIVELERYAMANKVWSEVKVKRLRLPDLLCVDCGRRFEAKSKTKLELKLSHSSAVGREWWAGGMRPEDVFAFVRVAVTDGEVDLGQILYVTRQGLENASADRRKGGMKAASEGSETDVSWPIWVPSYPGVFTRVDVDPELIIRVQKTDGRLMSRARGKWSRLHLYLRPGDSFEAGPSLGPWPPLTSIAPAKPGTGALISSPPTQTPASPPSKPPEFSTSTSQRRQTWTPSSVAPTTGGYNWKRWPSWLPITPTTICRT